MTPTYDEVLSALRAEVDVADRALIRALARRRRAVACVAERKRCLGLPAFDPAREGDVLERWRECAASEGLPPEEAEELLRVVLSWSRREVARVVEGG